MLVHRHGSRARTEDDLQPLIAAEALGHLKKVSEMMPELPPPPPFPCPYPHAHLQGGFFFLEVLLHVVGVVAPHDATTFAVCEQEERESEPME